MIATIIITPRAPPIGTLILALLVVVLSSSSIAAAWVTPGGSSSFFMVRTTTRGTRQHAPVVRSVGPPMVLFSATEKQQESVMEDESLVYDYETPDDAVIHIQPRAMHRLRELRAQQFRSTNKKDDSQQPQYLVLRMGVRNGGCSGMSYVMDFAPPDSINTEEDTVDTYEKEKIQCVVDSKSLLYLYGLELDYSNELVGGGFRFKNPNAEESCGCGSSFAV